jgi:hypothetical protein
MSHRNRYTAISRTTSFDYVNVIDEKQDDLPETDLTKLQRRIAEKRRMEDEIYKKRGLGLTILNGIIKNINTSDQYAIKHTLKTRQDLLKYLKIEDGLWKVQYRPYQTKERMCNR